VIKWRMMSDRQKPEAAPDRFTAFLRALIRVPKAEIERLEAERPKRRKTKKPAA